MSHGKSSYFLIRKILYQRVGSPLWKFWNEIENTRIIIEITVFSATYVFLFYSLVKNGLLLNTLTAGKFDYESVYLQEGYLYYLFNAGSGNLLIKSKKLLNDGKWHTVQAIRDYKDGKINKLVWLQIIYYAHWKKVSLSSPSGSNFPTASVFFCSLLVYFQ